jgi:FlaA1/EpsC-like NDP-sugar epimerase
MDYLTDKYVLVTGGCGSIGSNLIDRILDQEPEQLRILDVDEQALHRLRTELKGDSDAPRYLLGDIRDKDRLEMAMENVDVVFHAAALKHVDLSEYNPFEAVRTNVDGTQNVIRAAIDEEVDSVVTISTDKASNPISVMGATKLLSERLTVAANTYKGKRNTSFGCVRFGNVANSNGSVIPTFIDQLRDGGPLTVTDSDMTRFIMPAERAVDLTVQAAENLEGGEVFILKMPSFRLGDLVEVVREEFAPTFGYEPADIEVREIGPRPGERYHEKLVSTDELRFAEETDDMYVLYPQIEFGYTTERPANLGRDVDSAITSADGDRLSKSELAELISKTAERPFNR